MAVLLSIQKAVREKLEAFIAWHYPGLDPTYLDLIYVSQFTGLDRVIVVNSWQSFYDLLCNDPFGWQLSLSQPWPDLLKTLTITDRPGEGWYIRADTILMFLGSTDQQALEKLR